MSVFTLSNIRSIAYQEAVSGKANPMRFVPLWVTEDPEDTLAKIRDELAVCVAQYITDHRSYDYPMDVFTNSMFLPPIHNQKMGLYLGKGTIGWIFLNSIVALMSIDQKRRQPIHIEREISFREGSISSFNIKMEYDNGQCLQYAKMGRMNNRVSNVSWQRQGIIEQSFDLTDDQSFQGLLCAAELFAETGSLDESYRLHLARPLGLDLNVLSQEEKGDLLSYDLML